MIAAAELSENGAKTGADGRHTAIKSFRDPAGAVYRHGNRILRVVRPESAAELDEFLATRAAREAMDAGKLVRSLRISPLASPRELCFPDGAFPPGEFPIPDDAFRPEPGTAFYE